MLSDPIALDVKALESLSISLFLPTATGPCTCHFAGAATAFVSQPGNFTAAAFEPASTFTNRAFISAVEVTTAGPRTIVAFGDSITDGTASTACTPSFTLATSPAAILPFSSLYGMLFVPCCPTKYWMARMMMKATAK